MRSLLCLCGCLLALAGCGKPEGSLSLRLVRAGFENPYDRVTELRLLVLGPDLALRQELSQPLRTGPLQLGDVEGGEQRFEVEGRDASGVLSRGLSRVLTPAAKVAVDEMVPFSTLTTAAALPAESAFLKGFVADGNLDEWSASPSLVLDETRRVAGPGAAPTDLRPELALAWDAERLYFALRVADDCPALRAGLPAGSCGVAERPDRLALGFSGHRSTAADYGAGDLWLDLHATGVTVARGTLDPADLAITLAPLPGVGWVAEGSLRLAALDRGPLGVTDSIGFDLMIVDEDPGESEPTVLRWTLGAPTTEPTAPSAMGAIGAGVVP